MFSFSWRQTKFCDVSPTKRKSIALYVFDIVRAKMDISSRLCWFLLICLLFLAIEGMSKFWIFMIDRLLLSNYQNSWLFDLKKCIRSFIAKNRTKRIIKGEEVMENLKNRFHRFFYIAKIRLKEKNRYLCGGTVISRWHILTAAHCFPPKVMESKFSNPNQYKVQIGSTYLDNRGGIERELLEYYIPKNYNPVNGSNDIAIIRVRAVQQ